MTHFELRLPKNCVRAVSKWDNVYSAICAAVLLIEKTSFPESKKIPTTFELGSRSALVFLSMVYVECKKDMGEELSAPEKHLDDIMNTLSKTQPEIMQIAASRIRKYVEIADTISILKRRLRRDERLVLALVEKFVPLWNSMEDVPYSLKTSIPRR